VITIAWYNVNNEKRELKVKKLTKDKIPLNTGMQKITHKINRNLQTGPKSIFSISSIVNILMKSFPTSHGCLHEQSVCLDLTKKKSLHGRLKK